MSRRFAAAASIAFVLALAILIVDQTFLFRNLDRLIASLFVLSGMLTLATIIGTAYERGRVPRPARLHFGPPYLRPACAEPSTRGLLFHYLHRRHTEFAQGCAQGGPSQPP